MTYRTSGVCADCGKECELWMIRDDLWLCDECTESDGWEQCDICEDFYTYDAVEFTDLPDGRHVCEYCMEDYPWDE